MPDSQRTEIRDLDLFADMDETHFQTLLRGSYVQNFPPGVELITEGDPSDFLHIVLSGAVDLFARWNRRDTVLDTMRPVSTFILAATIRDAPYLMSARTLEKSRIALIPSQDVRAVFENDMQFARAVVTELAQRYRTAIRQAKNLKLRTSLERLANHLLHRQAEVGGVDEFSLATEKRHLASYLGMTPENLSRAFRGLRPYGVFVNGRQVTVSDQAALERFAKPSPLIDSDSS